MPYSTNGKRDYKKEYAKYHSRPEQRKNRSKRVLARRKMISAGRARKGDGKDVHHKKPLISGGSNNTSNLTMKSRKTNRSVNRKKK